MSKVKFGDTLSLKRFAFTNKAGGTGLSDWEYDEQFSGNAQVVVVHMFFDYETGWRYWGRAVSDDLIAYIDRNTGEDKRVLFSEWDIETS